MRILLDANVPKALKGLIVGHEVWTAREARLHDVPDKLLLDAAENRFDVLVTLDRSLRHQQALSNRSIAVAVLVTKSSRLQDLLPVLPELLQVISLLRPGTVREVGPS